MMQLSFSKCLRLTLFISLSLLSSLSFAKESNLDFYKSTKPISLLALQKQNKIESFQLKNGLQVYIMPDKTKSEVYYNVWYKAGAAEDPNGKTGLAHLLGNLMTTDFKKNIKEPMDISTKENEVYSDTDTTWDSTCYRISFNKNDLEKVMALDAARFAKFDLSKEKIETEKRVLEDKRKKVTLENSFSPIFKAANAAFFWEHPYGKPVEGYEQDINQIALKDVQNFFNTWYAPNNAILVIGGDVSISEIKSLVEKHYGKLETKSIPERVRSKEPTHPKVTSCMIWPKANLSQVHFQYIFRTPEHKKGDAAMRAGLALLADILGHPTAGILQDLVHDKSNLKYVTASYIDLLDNYSFVIVGNTLDKVGSVQPWTDVAHTIARLGKGGVREEQLKNAKKYFNSKKAEEIRNTHYLMEMVGKFSSFGYSLSDIDSFFTKINNLSIAEVNAALSAVFSNGPELLIYAY